MADVRDWGAFVRGRWDWGRHGYEKGFPRNSQFGDVDATVEFNGVRLTVETKGHDGTGPMDYPPAGQLMSLRDDVRRGVAVLVVYGCGVCNSPFGVRRLGIDKSADRWEDWRGFPLAERRRLLKYEIDRALGLIPDEAARVEAELRAAKPEADPWGDVVVRKPGDGLPDRWGVA